MDPQRFHPGVLENLGPARFRLRGIGAIVIALALLPLSGCRPDANVLEITQRDIAILQVVLHENCGAGDARLVVSTQPARTPSRHVRNDDEHTAEFTAAMSRRSQASIVWPVVDVCPQMRIVDVKSIEATFEGDSQVPPSWETFRRTFSGAIGVVRVSLPVYTGDGVHAVVFRDSSCGPLCGHGRRYELLETNGVWRITREDGTWIA
jgi:hypothetical protein